MRFKKGSNKVVIELRVAQFSRMISDPNCTPLSSITIMYEQKDVFELVWAWIDNWDPGGRSIHYTGGI